MIETKQTILHDPANGKHGNCFSAVLASLLHIEIDTVPVFKNPQTWRKDLNVWLRQFGLCYMAVNGFDAYAIQNGIKGLWHETAGATNRSNDVLHACVSEDCKVVFDPHPDGSGLTNIEEHGVFISLNPWITAKATQEFLKGRASIAGEVVCINDVTYTAGVLPA